MRRIDPSDRRPGPVASTGARAGAPAGDAPATVRDAERLTLRQRLAEELADRLDPAMSALGVIFLLLVIAEAFAEGRGLTTAFTVAGWVIWAVFVAEFAVRLTIAPSRSRFLKRNWWQFIFLAVPFLRFLRLIRTLRLARAGRLFSSAVRSTRSANRTLGSRIGWLAAVHVIVVLIASQLLYEFAGVRPYGEALHLAALSTVAGEPFPNVDGAMARALEVLFATYSVVIFGTIAATLGAFFIERRGEQQRRAALTSHPPERR